MGKYKVEFEKQALKDLKKHQKAGNKSTIKKIDKIILELSEHPRTGEGQPEELRNELTGYWSRRINQKDRLIYTINDKIVTVQVVSAMGHYYDK